MATPVCKTGRVGRPRKWLVRPASSPGRLPTRRLKLIGSIGNLKMYVGETPQISNVSCGSDVLVTRLQYPKFVPKAFFAAQTPKATVYGNLLQFQTCNRITISLWIHKGIRYNIWPPAERYTERDLHLTHLRSFLLHQNHGDLAKEIRGCSRSIMASHCYL